MRLSFFQDPLGLPEMNDAVKKKKKKRIAWSHEIITEYNYNYDGLSPSVTCVVLVKPLMAQPH